jgi:acyl-CoA thioester hydrolase
MESQGIVMPIISVSCAYKRPALFGDTLRVTVILEKLPTVKIEFKYEVRNTQEVLLATGSTVLAFAHKESLRPMRTPQYLLDILEPHFKL